MNWIINILDLILSAKEKSMYNYFYFDVMFTSIELIHYIFYYCRIVDLSGNEEDEVKDQIQEINAAFDESKDEESKYFSVF